MADIKGIEFEIRGTTTAAAKSIDRLKRSLNSLGSSTRKAGSGLSDLEKSAAKSSSGISKFASSLKRIAMYRAVRSIISGITSALSDGIKNLYEYSRIVGTDFAGSLDAAKSAATTFKNSVAAAVSPLISQLIPILVTAVRWVVEFNNSIGAMFAALAGKSSYTAAIWYQDKYTDSVNGTTAAVKELRRYLAPFDELNVLPGNSGSGGGGGASIPDYASMFEERVIDPNSFASQFALTVDDVLFDWSNLTGEQIAEKALAGMFAVTGGVLGFMIAGVPGAIVGTFLGLTFGLVVDTLIFDHDGVLSRDEILTSACVALAALAGGIIGFAVGGPAGAAIGITLGAGAVLAMKTIQVEDSQGNKTDFLSAMVEWLSTTTLGTITSFAISPLGAQASLAMDLLVKLFPSLSLGGNSRSKRKTGANGKFELDFIGYVVQLIDKVPEKQKHVDVTVNFTDDFESKFNKHRVVDVTAQYTDSDQSKLPKNKRDVTTTAVLTDSDFSPKWGKPSAYTTALLDDHGFSSRWNTPSAFTTALLNLHDFASTWKTPFAYVTALLLGYNFAEKWEKPLAFVGALFNGYDFATSWTKPWAYMTAYFNAAYALINGVWKAVTGKANGGAYYGGMWHDIPQYAGGTSNAHGSLFLAGEAGPEVVGHVNGRTEVLNQSQIASAIAAGTSAAISNAEIRMSASSSYAGYDGADEDMLYRAFKRALDETEFGGEVIGSFDGDALYRGMVRRNRQNTRMTGVNAFA